MKYIALLLLIGNISVADSSNWDIYKELDNNFWYVLSIILLVFEIGLSGIGLFFAAVGAALTGICVSYDVVPQGVSEWTYFFTLTFISVSVLWGPFRKISNRGKEYNNITKGRGIVESEKLNKHSLGTIKWSGTVVNAMLDNSSSDEELIQGDEVEIVSTEKNIFYVKKII